MDRAQRTVLRLRAENKYLKSKRQVFQDFVSGVLQHSRKGDYEDIRLTQGDGGLDGIILSESAVVAVTAPRRMTDSDLLSKIESDLASARTTLQDRGVELKKFVFVHNDEGLTKNVGPALMKLRQDEGLQVEIWTFARIWQELESLTVDDLGELLGSAPTDDAYFHLDIPSIAEVIAHLTSLKEEPDIADALTIPDVAKLEHNRLSPDNSLLIRLGRFKQELVRTYLENTLDVDVGEEIAEAFRRRYASCCESGMSKDDTFRELWTLAGGDQFFGPQQTVAVAAVMSYYFDSCDIFENAPDES